MENALSYNPLNILVSPTVTQINKDKTPLLWERKAVMIHLYM